MNWWKDGISINESKFSTLIFGFLIVIGFIIYFTFTRNESIEYLSNIAITLIWAIAGINGVKSLSEMLSKVKKDENTPYDYSSKI